MSIGLLQSYSFHYCSQHTIPLDVVAEATFTRGLVVGDGLSGLLHTWCLETCGSQCAHFRTHSVRCQGPYGVYTSWSERGAGAWGTPMPRAVPLTVVLGTPLVVPHVEHPTREQVSILLVCLSLLKCDAFCLFDSFDHHEFRRPSRSQLPTF